MTEIKGKNVTVIGLARSGAGAANLLHLMGSRVTVTDRKNEKDLGTFITKLHPSVRRALGSHPDEVIAEADMLVVSPGVPMDIAPVMKARQRGIPVIGELELAYQAAAYYNSARYDDTILQVPITKKAEFLAVTGTNGKSTTTALLEFMVRKSGFKTLLGGNIGNALTEEIAKMVSDTDSREKALSAGLGVDFVVAEVSSFQLESIHEFEPLGAAVLNITPDHLDRYPTLQGYCQAKTRIFENQTHKDFLVLNHDDPATLRAAKEKLAGLNDMPKIFFFSRRESVKGLYCKGNTILCDFAGALPVRSHAPIIDRNLIKIKGVHNLENAMAASAMALLAGCPVESVREALKEFPGLEHRLEFVRDIDGVKYFNDSKGTNVAAVVRSLESFRQPVILIAGGRDKAGDFSLLTQLVKERVKALILIGEAREKIKKALGDLTETIMADDLDDAVRAAHKRACSGYIVLLSPACASFDMFEDFEDRGRQFKRIVREVKDE
jgi:UDP-N-acetylmuramoylalanine--D-glutamate ligase